MNISTPGLISWLRRAQFPESAVIYFATAAAAGTLFGIVVAVVGQESLETVGLWAAALLVGAIPHLAGTRPIVIGIGTFVMIVVIAFFPAGLLENPAMNILQSTCVLVVLYLWGRMDTRTNLLGPSLISVAGLMASFLWLAPIGHLFTEPTESVQRFLIATFFFMPSLAAITLARSTRRHNFGWLIPGDLRDSLFQVVGLFFAGLAGLGIASWVTIRLRAWLLSTPLESIITIAGWFSGALAALLVLWAVVKLPAAFSRAQMSGRLYPRAIAESIWIIVLSGGFAIVFELSEMKFGPAVLIVLGMAVVYVTVRVLMSAPLPPGQSALWIVPLKPVDRRLRATVQKLVAAWNAGPTTLLATPEAARKLADAHLRASVKTRTLDRLFPLRSAHLADWDEGLPPQHAWNALPLRELYANASLWPEILAARMAPQASLVALGSEDLGVLIRATTDTLRLSPGLDSQQLQDIAAQPLQTSKALVDRLKEIQKSMSARARDVLILHFAADVQEAWELHSRLAGVHDASGAQVRPFVIPLERIALPSGCNGMYLAMVRRMFYRRAGPPWRRPFRLGEGFVSTWLALLAPKPADEYDLVVIEPVQKPISKTARVAGLFARRIAGGAFDRVVSLQSPTDSGTLGKVFEPENYTDSICWSSSPVLSARAADAAQKLLASPLRDRNAAPAVKSREPKSRWLKVWSFLVFIGYLFLAPLVWYAGPYLAFADKTPLESVIARLVVIALLLIWPVVKVMKSVLASAEPGMEAVGQEGGRKADAADSERLGKQFGEALDAPEPDQVTVSQQPAAETETQTADVELAAKGEHATVELPHDDRLWYAAFSPIGDLLLTTSKDCTARLWNSHIGQRFGSGVTFRHEQTVTHAEFDPHGRYLVTGGRDAAVKVWDPYTGELVGVLLGHTAPVVHVAFNPRGSRIVSCGDLTARIWHVGEYNLRAHVRHEAQIVRAEFSPRGETLLTCSHDCTARIWDATTGQPVGDEMRHTRAINYATFSPDGNIIATASEDRSVVLWSAYSGHPLGIMLCHEKPIRRVVFSPDGSMLATASMDETAVLWRASSGQRLATFAHRGAVNCVTFSADRRRIASASDDGLVREWNVNTGALLEERPLTGHAYYVAYNPESTRLVAIDASTSAKLWAIG